MNNFGNRIKDFENPFKSPIIRVLDSSNVIIPLDGKVSLEMPIYDYKEVV